MDFRPGLAGNAGVKSPRLFLVALMASLTVLRAEVGPTLDLWPGIAPGDQAATEPERDTTKPDGDLVAGKRLIRLGNVSKPTLTVYRPPAEKANGAAVVVFPGGGYHILALDLEGSEVCEWLNSIGVTAVLVKYRVPVRKDRAPHAAPLEDAQRAIGMVRQHAGEWGIDPARIGVLGFSAGGHLSAAISTNYRERNYPTVDAADSLSCRPDFSVLIYPAYLAKKDDGYKTLNPDLPVNTNTPPTFIAITQDDPVRVENALVYYSALNVAKVPAELHIYPKGGHGYGLRKTDEPVTSWPDRVAEWMRAGGWLKGKK